MSSYWYCTDCEIVEEAAEDERLFQMNSCNECGSYMVIRPPERIPAEVLSDD